MKVVTHRLRMAALSQEFFRLLSLTGWSPADGLTLQIQSLLRTSPTIVLSQSTMLAFFKLASSKLGKERSSEALQFEKKLDFPAFRSFLCFQMTFPMCVYCMYVSLPSANTFLPLLILSLLLLQSSWVFLPFNCLTGIENEPDQDS